ncbi:MAG: serine protease [Candidatus Krumholzibacteria bacterium]|nr:serine protease [Candidatus Krumholzibacteria bacterium]
MDSRVNTLAAVPLLALALSCGAAKVSADVVDDTIVYLECTANGATSRGTGVVVSAKGHVLTAKHVVPDGAACVGSIGVADPNTAGRMIVQPTNLPVDAALLQFSRQQEYVFAPYCPLEDWMVRRKIFVAGFPGKTQTGAASYREGILSTVIPNAAGILETDGQTVSGMSGGPVFSKNLAGIVGIVIGAEFDNLGTVSFYGILPASSYARDFGLTESEQPCYRQYREVDLSDPDSGDWTAVWKAGDGPVPLGVTEDQGFCFLEGVKGLFNDPDDEVWVENLDGEYILNGFNRSGGTHGGTARCIWFE